MKLRVFYEDDYLAVVEKPSGVIAHGRPGHYEHTFLDHLNDHFSKNPSKEEVRVRLVHRLDRGCSGLMIIARSLEAAKFLNMDFRERKIQKGYIAFVFGKTSENFVVKVPIGRVSGNPQRWGADQKNGLKAETFFETVWSCEDFSLLRVKPITGRTHQIRIHCAWEGHPIVGDSWHVNDYIPISPWQKYLYSHAQRLCLHAYHLEFEHPLLKAKMRFWCQLPDAFLDIVRTVSASQVDLDASSD